MKLSICHLREREREKKILLRDFAKAPFSSLSPLPFTWELVFLIKNREHRFWLEAGSTLTWIFIRDIYFIYILCCWCRPQHRNYNRVTLRVTNTSREILMASGLRNKGKSLGCFFFFNFDDATYLFRATRLWQNKGVADSFCYWSLMLDSLSLF